MSRKKIVVIAGSVLAVIIIAISSAGGSKKTSSTTSSTSATASSTAPSSSDVASSSAAPTTKAAPTAASSRPPKSPATQYSSDAPFDTSGVTTPPIYSATPGPSAPATSDAATSDAATTEAPSTSPPPPVKPAPPKAPGIPGDGTYSVGSEVKADTYRATSPTDNCYWELSKDATGNPDSIIANDNPAGPTVVTISSTDKYFTSQGCGTWTSDLGQVSTSEASITDGAWIVGTDLLSGTFKSTGGDNCYWERTSDFRGSFDSIIANDNPTGQAVVEVRSSDKGFLTSGCGTWHRVN